MKRLLLLLIVGGAVGAYYSMLRAPGPLVLTGIVTTEDVIVGPQVGGQIGQLLVKEGDQVGRNQLIAVMATAELEADRAYYAHTAESIQSQVGENEAALRYEQRQTEDQIQQAQAALETAVAQKVEVQRAAVAVANANAEHVRVQQNRVRTSERQREAAAAQRKRADVRLSYSEVRAPVDGIVDVRAAREGEVITAGQPIVTLINPDDLWVRADIEETYIDRIRLGDQLKVRLPSGDQRMGSVFYRALDAGFATQRDVSRTKRDIKTFEVRLHVDNRDRRLAVGMTTYVELPIQ